MLHLLGLASLLSSRFSNTEGVSGSSLAKSSVARNIKKSIIDSYPLLDSEEEDTPSHLDGILGDKKQPLYVIKWSAPGASERVTVIWSQSVLLLSLTHLSFHLLAPVSPPRLQP